jgi:branched-chain amino acid transport system permease protein
MSFYTLIYIIVGGALTFSGPIVGAAALTLIPEFFRATGVYQMLIFGIILVLSMLFMPRGMMGLVEERALPMLRRRWGKQTEPQIAP